MRVPQSTPDQGHWFYAVWDLGRETKEREQEEEKKKKEMVDRQLVEDFHRFVSEKVSNIEIVKQRVSTIVQLLREPSVSVYPLGMRVAFLRFQSFSLGEIEAALEQTNEREYLHFLEVVQGGGLESLYCSALDEVTTKEQAAQAAKDAAAGALLGDELTGEFSLWRPGVNVYAFQGDGSYYPVPLVGVDPTRAEDVLMIRHQLPSGEYGPLQYMTAGFKGVVPDEFAPYELVTPGLTVIAEYPGAFRGHFKEAVILGKSASANSDGSYCVDIEWVHDSEHVSGVEYRSIRLLLHPKRMQAELQRAATERRKHQSNGDRYNSTTSFQFCPSEFGAKITDPAQDYVKNFMKYPHLDTGVQPRTMRTGAHVASHYGQFYHNQGIKSFPMYPPSQYDGSMTGFGFQLSRLERHPLSTKFFVRNPIVEVCDECSKKDSMFIDPDFPPSFFSITGRNDEIPAGVVWRRCSEVFNKPRLFAVGSKAIELVPGTYSPPWLLSVFCALQAVAEIEEMISPGADGWVFGAYSVKLFLNGCWVYTIVDDFVPCVEGTGEPLAMLSSSPGEIYSCILEKALAKVAGSYQALKHSSLMSSPAKAWEDLSSNTLEHVDHPLILQKDSLSENLHALVQSGTNGKLFARVKGEERFEDMGFGAGEWWTVDYISEYVAPGRRVPLYFFHVCRPPHVGKHVPYIDSYKEKLFRQFPADVIDHFPTRGIRDEGVAYWLSSSDYYNIFDRSYSFWYYNNTQRVVVNASFRNRPTCGPKMDGLDRWFANPQIYLSFVQPTDVIIEVKLLDRRYADNRTIDGTVLQAHVVRGLPVEKPLSEELEYIASSEAVNLTDDMEAVVHPTAVIRATLPGGNFVLIPSIGRSSTEDVLVKVFSVSAFYAKVLN